MNLELQRKLLSDTLRNTQFHRALKKLVRKGDVVIDLGAGTGFLGLLALQLGAGKVIFVEENPILEMALTLASRLGVSSRCEFHQCHSSELTLTQKADLVICETLGSYPFEEFILETIQEGKKFLKPKGRLLPSDLKLWLTPVCSPVIQKRVDSWSRLNFDLPWEDIRPIALSRMYVEPIPSSACLKPAQMLRTFPFTQTPPPLKWSSPVSWTAKRALKIFGFCLFWESTLTKDIRISTSPWKPPTHWQQIYLPLLDPLSVTPSQRLEVEVSSECRRSMGVHVRWAGRVLSTRREVIHTFKVDTDDGRVGYW